MSAPAKVLEWARRMGVKLEARGDRIAYDAPRAVMSPELADSLRQHKDELLELLRRERREHLDLATDPKAKTRCLSARIGTLSLSRVPHHWPAATWPQFIADAQAFCRDWAERASLSGWAAWELFGCHCRAPWGRIQGRGLVLLLRGRELVALTSDEAVMGIALRDQSGNLRRSEDLLADVADAFARVEDPAERVRLAFKLFDSEGVALVNLLRDGSGALEEIRERARDLGIVLDEHLVRDAERARTELDTLSQVISANLTRAALEAAPVIADLSSWLADVAGKAGIAWERLFDAPEEKSLRTLRYELDLTESTIAKLEERIQELRESPTLGFTTFLDTAQISALQKKIDELSRVRGQTQARIAFLEGPPEQPESRSALPAAPDDTAGVKDRAERLQRIQQELESTLFGITHEGSERIIAEHERRIAEIEALRTKDGSNAQHVDQLIGQSAAVREAQLSQLRAKEVKAAEKVRAANERVVASLGAVRDALAQTERERFVAQALSRLSAEATAQQRREVEQFAGALFDEQQALKARQRLLDEGRTVIDRTRTATEQYAAEFANLNELLAAGAIDQATYVRAVEDANDRALRSSQAWTDGAARFLKDYVAESNDAATATERAFANAFGGAEDALVGFISTGKLEFRSLADSILADLARTTVRQTITAPLAGALQSAFAGGGLFNLFHEGGVIGERAPAARYADATVFEHAQRYHGGGFAGSGLLPDEVPIIARRGELVVPPERVVREEKTAREQRPITVVVNVTAADASSFRASQGQIAADMARAIDRASRNR